MDFYVKISVVGPRWYRAEAIYMRIKKLFRLKKCNHFDYWNVEPNPTILYPWNFQNNYMNLRSPERNWITDSTPVDKY